MARQSVARSAAARHDKQPSPAKIAGLVHHYAPADCNTPTSKKHTASCQALVRTTSDQRVMVTAAGPPLTASTSTDIQSAYHLPATGQGQTVAIVDAYGHADAEADLSADREQFGLLACTTETGCFHKVGQWGGVNCPPDGKGFALGALLHIDDALGSECASRFLGAVPFSDRRGDRLDGASCRCRVGRETSPHHRGHGAPGSPIRPVGLRMALGGRRGWWWRRHQLVLHLPFRGRG